MPADAPRSNLEREVARHYGRADVWRRIRAGLQQAGIALERLRRDDLAPFDEFHIGGSEATAAVVDGLSLRPEHHVLDVGCGIGGPARHVAAQAGCRVTGIDLVPEYNAVARRLTNLTGLASRVACVAASALDLPFPPARFDAAITLHAAMNIADRRRLYREVARVLRPGAAFGIYDVMRTGDGPLAFPVPWAATSATSHLRTPDQTAELLDAAGFEVVAIEERRQLAVDFLDRMIDAEPNAAAATAPPAVRHRRSAGSGSRFENLRDDVARGLVAPVRMLAHRRDV